MSTENNETASGCGCLLMLLAVVLCFTCTKQAISVIDGNRYKQTWISETAYPKPKPSVQADTVQESVSSTSYTSSPSYTITYDYSSSPSSYSSSSSGSINWSGVLKGAGEILHDNPETVLQIIECGMYLFGDYKRGGGGHYQHYDSSTGRYD